MPPTAAPRFQCGSIQLVGLLRNYWMADSNSYPATIAFPAESHIYDVLDGKYLGFTRQITAEISDRARFYALSPYKVRAVEVRGPSKCVAGAAATFRMEMRAKGDAKPSQHLFRVEVFDPGGKIMAHYAENVLAENGVAEVRIPWALNDKPGQYTLKVRDVMSGVRAQLRVKLKEAK